ncbi:MAG: hypothetical protein GY705_04820 [Bacteroidetes bacterium]|nr:hypothetical protein [Bacteroidota bacterium]
MNYEIGFDASLILDYNFDDGLFTILYDIKEPLSKGKIKEMLSLVEKYYPNSTFKEDWFIQAKGEITLKEYIKHYYINRQGLINDITINIPVYIQGIDGEIHSEKTKVHGIELLVDESDEDPIYGIKIYPYAYFDYTTLTKKGKKIDQRKAAKKNREILRSLLLELEEVIGGKPEVISSAHPHFEDKIYEYGVREEAEYLL